jgi:hypothetical protein
MLNILFQHLLTIFKDSDTLSQYDADNLIELSFISS